MQEEEITLEEIAADFGVPVEDVRRREAYGDLVPFTPLAGRYALEGEEGVRQAREAQEKLSALMEDTWETTLFGEENGALRCCSTMP